MQVGECERYNLLNNCHCIEMESLNTHIAYLDMICAFLMHDFLFIIIVITITIFITIIDAIIFIFKIIISVVIPIPVLKVNVSCLDLLLSEVEKR